MVVVVAAMVTDEEIREGERERDYSDDDDGSREVLRAAVGRIAHKFLTGRYRSSGKTDAGLRSRSRKSTDGKIHSSHQNASFRELELREEAASYCRKCSRTTLISYGSISPGWVQTGPARARASYAKGDEILSPFEGPSVQRVSANVGIATFTAQPCHLPRIFLG